MTVNDQLLEAVRKRRASTQKSEPFRFGILPADVYVRTMQDVIGLDKCYQYFSRGLVSFDDAVKRAARTLVYSNPEMELEEATANADQFKRLMREAPSGVELPKNSLIVFRHKLTSSRKDRDGDTLHSDGATLDPKMLLLWQHVHTAPLGPYLYTSSQDDKSLRVVSAIIDMNDLCHDAAVMVDNGMGRFSHGFRAVDFTETKADRNGQGGGFDVKRFEVMEESLVSVPANVDAETEEVLLSLVEGGKLTSPVMKSYGRELRDHRAIQVPVKLDVKVLVNGQEVKHENERGDRKAEGEGGAGKDGTSASEEADVGAKDQGHEEKAGDAKVMCPECGEEVMPDEDGNCPECGEPVVKEEEEEKEKEEKSFTPPDAKPLPNEHAARMADPKQFDKVRRQNNKFGDGVHAIWGVTADGKMVLQSIHFDKDKFTPEEAKKWLEDHDYKPTTFEPAKQEEKEMKIGEKGDLPGHPFRGNQWGRGGGEGGGSREALPTNNEGGGAFYAFHGKYEREEATKKYREAATGIIDKFRVAPEISRNYLDSVHGRHVAERMIDKKLPVYEAMVSHHGSERKARSALQDIESQTRQGYFDEEGKSYVSPNDKIGEKQGRVLSKANETKIADALDDINEAAGLEGTPRPCKALLKSASGSLREVLGSLGEMDGQKEMTVGDAIKVLLVEATPLEQRRAMDAMRAVAEGRRRKQIMEQYRAVLVR